VCKTAEFGWKQMAERTSFSSGLGSWSTASASSLWVASTRWSNSSTLAPFAAQLNAVVAAPHGKDRRGEAEPAFGDHRRQDGVDVVPRAAGDRAPVGLVADGEQPVAVEEARQRRSGMSVNVVGSADQIDEPSGTRYQSTNALDHRPSSSMSRNV